MYDFLILLASLASIGSFALQLIGIARRERMAREEKTKEASGN